MNFKKAAVSFIIIVGAAIGYVLLQHRTAAFKSSKTQIDAILVQNEQLKKNLAQKELEFKKTLAALDSLKEEILQKSESLKEKEKQEIELKNELVESRFNAQSLDGEVKDLRERVGELSNELKSAKLKTTPSVLNGNSTLLEGKVEELDVKLAALANANSYLENKLSQMKQMRASLQTELNQKESNLDNQKKEIEILRASLNETEMQKEGFYLKLRKTEAEVSKFQNTITQLQNQIKSMEGERR